MCELLALSANVPTDICFSFTGLSQRAGVTGPHRDGWGIAFYEGGACREFKDVRPACDSVIADLVKNYPIKSTTIISHIRQANVGDVCLKNTHPFRREMFGKAWCYAHNGQLKEGASNSLFTEQDEVFYQPIGDTDSEAAFCWLLNQMRQKPELVESPYALCEWLQERCHILAEQGVFNMLLSDGDTLYTYCSTKLSWITRSAPFTEAKLNDVDLAIDFSNETQETDVVTMIATQPLTDNEDWNIVESGTLTAFQGGECIVAQAKRS